MFEFYEFPTNFYLFIVLCTKYDMVLNTLLYIVLVIIVIIVIVILLRFLFNVLFVAPVTIEHDVLTQYFMQIKSIT